MLTQQGRRRGVVSVQSAELKGHRRRGVCFTFFAAAAAGQREDEGKSAANFCCAVNSGKKRRRHRGRTDGQTVDRPHSESAKVVELED